MRRGNRSRSDDPVTPELRRYVFAREHYRCVVAILLDRRRLIRRDLRSCRDQWGDELVGGYSPNLVGLTAAHVRDAAGGRTGKRPTSKPRRVVTACYGHHIADPVVDQEDVRREIDAYLEALEGPDVDEDRPHEVIRRVRARGVPLPTSEPEGGRYGS